MNGRKSALKNRIFVVFGAVLAVALSLVSIRSAFVSAVALEQTARCGAEEHHHSPACYENNRLHCGKAEHTHNRNCYLVLLKDNDINSLLTHIDNDESHSLEALIDQTVDTAIRYNSDLAVANGSINPAAKAVPLSGPVGSEPEQSPAVSPPVREEATQVHYASAAETVQAADISRLNETISENNIEPNIVLNENLYDAAAVSGTPGDTVALLNTPADSAAQMNASGGASTLALGDKTQAGDYNANFYVYLDNGWQSIGPLTFSLDRNSTGSRYSARVKTSEVVNLINESLGTNLDYNDFTLKYGTNAQTSNWTSQAEISANYVSFGTNHSAYGSSGRSAKYAGVMNASGAALAFYTVTFEYADGSTESRIVPTGTSITLPEGTGWTDGTDTYDGGASVPITDTTTFTSVAPAKYYTVTYQYPDQPAETQQVREGTAVTLPMGYKWTANGNTYNGGDSVTIRGDTTFTGTVQIIEKTIRIRYNLNFSGSGVSATPSIVGGTGEQTVSGQETATIRTVSPRDPSRLPSGWNTAASAYYFVGWTATTAGGETVHISPGANMTVAQLAQYADANDVVQLTGNWDSGVANNSSTRSHVVTFFMGLRSEAPDYGENAGPAASPDGYTSCIYTAYMGNPPASSFFITDETPDNSYNVDKKIRALVGEKSDQLWLSSMPSDEQVFAALKSYAQSGKLSADGEVVDPDELTSEYYAIRWYVLKYDTGGSSADNGWHIDGRLVKKEGTIRVTKTFLSEDDVLAAAQNGFYIEANYDDPSGTANDRSVIMHLNNGTVSARGTESLAPTAVNGTTYEWHIKHIGVRQEWSVTEHILNNANTAALANHTVYSEYSLFDSSGLNQSAQAEYGSEVTVTGVTQAVDEGDQHMLRVDFTNYYLRKDSIALKKEDGSSGAGLPGVQFEMYHLNMDSPLKFAGTPGRYTKDDNGTVTRLQTDANGYIAISGFSYDRDLVVFREVAPPSGYSTTPDITLQGNGSDDTLTVQIVRVGDKDASSMSQNDLDATAEFHNAEHMLVIKDYSVEDTSVTVTKKWAVSDALRPDTVTVELYANGRLASNVIPGLSPVSVTLTRGDGYTYTWNDLPAYVNGSEVTWSVYETAVGMEKRTVTGEFVNWVDSYDPPIRTYVEGQLVNTELVVRNDARRTMLNILKTDEEGTTVLPGARFRLVSLSSNLTSTGTYNQTLVTDENGRLTFDNLTAGYYLLTEVSPPDGYEATMKDTTLYIDASGAVQEAALVNGSVVKTDLTGNPAFQSAFTLRVTNHLAGYQIPETGGSGPGVSYGLGGAMMLLTACGYILLKSQERGRRQSGT